jgi:hypothetical protein
MEAIANHTNQTANGAPVKFIPQLDSMEMFELDTAGFCINCGAEQDGCEPDAREYKCDSCDHHTVYGVEELMVMGLVDLTD